MAARPGETFQNGETCKGTIVHIDPSGLYETDIIEIDGQYPAHNEFYDQWLINEESEVTIKVLRGKGAVAIRSIETMESASYVVKRFHRLDAEADGRAVVVPPNTYYSWGSFGDEPFVTQATFQPPFDPEKYHVVAEDELEKEGEL